MNYCVDTNLENAEQSVINGGLSHAQIADTLAYLRENGYSPAKLQKISGCRDYTVRHYLRLSKKLIPAVKEMLHKKRISFSMARTIASLSEDEQEQEARKVLMYRTSVHRLRDKLSGSEKILDERTLRYYESLAELFRQQTGIVLNIIPDNHNKHAGTITMRYSDLRDFDAICTRLNVDLSDN